MGRTRKIKYICQTCEKTYDNEEEFYSRILFQRVSPGEPTPAGQCDCGGLVYLNLPDWKNIVEKILEESEILPVLMHVDPELDELIAQRLAMGQEKSFKSKL